MANEMVRKFWGQKTYCIVTGASQGIGRNFAIEFSKQFGSDSVIVLMSRSFSGLESTSRLIAAANPNVKVKVHIVDLSIPKKDALETIVTESAGDPSQYSLSILVHNAGSLGKVNHLASEMNDISEWNTFMALNLYSVTMLTAAFLNVFKTGHRTLINVTSLCALQPFKSLGYYCIGKTSREMYFRVLAEENPSLDILNYSPGPVNTGMITDVIESVKSGETKTLFENLRNTGGLVSLDQTTARIIEVLRNGKYKSGDRVDYFEPL
ncbi:sepiapterin reductase-like [Lycorma delicatula]|uniref:sepiapterin reductase-like n=1 Tax=Lycorma delicatula TaxID=130591 RepID=UPI003F512775